MSGKTLVDITSQLEEPFSLESIELLPKGKLERDGKTLCMGMPYADVRVYEDRLNSLACGEWSTPPCTAIVAGTKLLTYVTVIVCGVAHTDVGESSITSENGGTEAWAQGFKRACSQFGLGRYLYDLDKEWVPYNVTRKSIDLGAAGIRDIARKMYQKAGIPVPAAKPLETSPQAQHNGTGHQPRTTAPTEAKATSVDASAQKQAKEAAIKYINPLKVEAVKAKFIYGDSDDELLRMWKERLRAIFGREVSDADLIESEAMRATVREAMERYAARNNAASGK